MTCSYKSGNSSNIVATKIFQYVEDVATGERDINEMIKVLKDYGVVTEVDGNLILVGDFAEQEILDINDIANVMFAASSPLVTISDLGEAKKIDISEDVFQTLNVVEDPNNQSAEVSTPQDEEAEVEEEAEEEDDYSEAFMRKENMDTVTQMIITNLQKQINRLERLEETSSTKKRIEELQYLKTQMFKIEKGKADITGYLEFTDYVEEVAERAATRMNKIEIEYGENYKTMSQERRAEILRDISELKETIDAFYSKDASRSIMTLLELKISKEAESGEIKDDLLLSISNSVEEMSSVNNRYLELGIPIQADYLLSFAPIAINEQIDAKIKKIKDSGQLSGINRLDKRYLKIALGLKNIFSQDRRKQLVDLNIKQLEESKIGREQIITELRESHKDASWFSMYADPLVYSSDTSIKLFAEAVKEKLVKANQATIDTKYRLRDAYKEFVGWKGVGEDNVAKLYEDILEETVIYRRDKETGEYKAFRVMSFVQPYDIEKFNTTKSNFVKSLREDPALEFPEDPSEYDDYFNSDLGKEYNRRLSIWYSENTEPVKDAQKSINALQSALNTATREYVKAKQNEDKKAQDRFGGEIGRIRHELDRVSRLIGDTRIPVGALTQPKMSKYSNSKFTSMPAEAKKYYTLLLDVYKEDQAKIGKSGLMRNSWEDFSYIIPSVRKSAYDKTREDGFKDSAKDLLTDAFTLQETDTEFGELVKANGERIMAVPRYFTNTVEASIVSKDITNSIIKFNDMSNRYKYKGEIIGVVNVMQAAIENRKITKMSATGDTVLDAVAKKLNFQLVPPREGRDTNSYKQLDAFIKSVFYGQSMDKDLVDSKLSSNKAVSFLTGLTAVSTLSFNLLQSGNQLVIDSAMSAQEGWGSQFYSREDLLWARSKMYYSGEMFGMLGEAVSPKFTKKNKIMQMMEKFDALQQFDEKFGEEAGTAAKKAISLNSLFFMQTGAELKTSAERMLALSRSYKGKLKDKSGKVVLNNKGEEADLWDVLIEDKNGKLIVDPKVANFDETRFVSLLHGISKRSNQLKGSFDRTMLERSHAGRLMLLFRKYFVPAYRKRWGYAAGGAAIDVELGQVMEGYYSTAFTTAGNAINELSQGNVKEAIKTILGKNATQDEKANLIRFLYEQTILTILATTALLGQSLLDDDDEDWVVGMIGYQMKRLGSELSAFYNPAEFGRIIMSPTATARPIINTWEAANKMYQTAIYNVTGIGDPNDIYYQRSSGRFEKGDAKWVKEFLDAVPIASGIFKSRDPAEASKYWDLYNK